MCPLCVQIFGHIMDTFWTHFGPIIFYGKIEQMCPKFGHIMDIFWIHFEFWTPYGHILDTFWVWTHFGHVLDTFQG